MHIMKRQKEAMNSNKFLLFLVCALYTCISAETELIESMLVCKNRIDVIINEEFKAKYLKSDFFAEYDSEIDLEELDYSLQIMPFILNVVSIVWISGSHYYIDSMDENLFYSLQKVKKVFEVLYPQTNFSGELIPRKLTTNVSPHLLDKNTHIALLFSGGLDSTTTSFHYFDKKQLLITAWGEWDMPLSNEELWNSRKKQFLEFAQRYGHTNSFIKSNYSIFLNRKVLDNLSPEITSWRINMVEGIGWAGLTAPILFSKGYQVLYIASSDTWAFKYPGACNPFVDDNIQYSDITLHHDFFDISRLEKIEFLSAFIEEHDIKEHIIKACTDLTEINCCDCDRCAITICGLLLFGEDIETYGYYITKEKAIEMIQNLLQREELRYDTVFHFECIIDRIKSELAHHKQIDNDLLWLLDVDLRGKAYDIEHRTKVDWSILHNLFPDVKCLA